jgi:predicted RNA-binding protein YlxR (DUF448 family)
MRKEILRKCVVTNQVMPRDNLFRIVKLPDNSIKIDYSYRTNGHGVYLKKDAEVVKLAQSKKVLDRLLETKVPEEIYQEMLRYL